jgi:thiol-disulfide isomerase/thioredoxin
MVNDRNRFFNNEPALVFSVFEISHLIFRSTNLNQQTMKKTISYIARPLLCFFFRHHASSQFSKLNHNTFVKIKFIPSPRELSALINCLASLAKKEIALERLKRKSFPLVLFLFASVTCQAQERIPEKKLMVGDKISIIKFSKILNYSDTAIHFSQLRGKAVILDFWATYCTACLKYFPKMDSLQKLYGKNLQIFLVNAYKNDTEPLLTDFLAKEKKRISSFCLPLIQSEENTRSLFPIKSMPHYIWVGSDGRIKAITGPEQINSPNIERLIAGLSLNIKNKIE